MGQSEAAIRRGRLVAESSPTIHLSCRPVAVGRGLRFDAWQRTLNLLRRTGGARAQPSGDCSRTAVSQAPGAVLSVAALASSRFAHLAPDVPWGEVSRSLSTDGHEPPRTTLERALGGRCRHRYRRPRNRRPSSGEFNRIRASSRARPARSVRHGKSDARCLSVHARAAWPTCRAIGQRRTR